MTQDLRAILKLARLITNRWTVSNHLDHSQPKLKMPIQPKLLKLLGKDQDRVEIITSTSQFAILNSYKLVELIQFYPINISSGCSQ
jgi:hypothetical protein